MITATRESTRAVARTRRLERATILSWLGLAGPLILAAVLNLWNLGRNGYGNTYYAVAVQSMVRSFSNFWYGAYDAGGFITVDKPPVALWVQAISAKIFGFSGLAILVPEALMGVAAVGLLWFLVRRHFGALAATVAAFALALTPIAVAVDRDNQTDPLLMLMLVLAAWALSRATEKGRLALLLLATALVGVAFNVKMLEAFIVLPTFYLLYLIAAPISWRKRLLHLTLAGVVLLGVALSWPLAVDLTPAAQRPWIGGSQTNSVLNLALGYNGLGRVTGQEGQGAPGGGSAPPNAGTFNPGGSGFAQNGDLPAPPTGTDGTQRFGAGQPPGGGNGGPGGNGGSGMFGAGVAGPLRLFGSELADQWSWLIPLGLIGVAAAIGGLRRRILRDPRGQAILLWGGWLLTYGVVFSMAEGIFHTYYLIMLAPAAAALVGIGVQTLWQAYRLGGGRTWLLPVGLLGTAAWQSVVLAQYPQWSGILVPITLGGSLIAGAALLATRLRTARLWRRLAPALLTAALVALFAAPALWSLSPVLAAGNGTMPEATAPLTTTDGGFGQGMPGGGQPGDTANSGLISYLQANQNGAFYLVAVASANQASSIALATGEPVLAMGGFTGSDPAMTVEKLQALITGGQVHYILGGGTSTVSQWIQTNCTVVDASTYGGTTGGTRGFGGPGGGDGTLYQCPAH